jgi:hypothetical protein
LVKATLEINGVKEVELDLGVEYGDSDEPVKVNIFYFVNPFSVDVFFDDTKSTSSSVSESLSKNGEILIAFGLKLSYYDNSKDDEAIKSVSGYVQLLNVKFVVNISTETLSGSEDISDILKISIKVSGRSAGKVIFVFRQGLVHQTSHRQPEAGDHAGGERHVSPLNALHAAPP